jgi:hypothetical protein
MGGFFVTQVPPAALTRLLRETIDNDRHPAIRCLYAFKC